MKRHHWIAMLVLGLVLISAGPAMADVAGKWEGQVETALGTVNYHFELQPKGSELTGKVTRDNPAVTTTEIVDGKITGDEVTFVEVLDLQGQPIKITYKGKVTGDEMKLTRDTGDYGTQELTLKRVKSFSTAFTQPAATQASTTQGATTQPAK